MSSGSMKAQIVRLCPECGRELEPYECCECARRLPRDGLRARCERFVSRSSYRGNAYINCGGQKLRFNDYVARDRYYMEHCCADGQDGCAENREKRQR